MKARPIYALLFFVLMVICYRLSGYTGHYGYDDMQYAEIAANMLNGNIDFDDHFTFRFTIIAATALCYRLFGINDFASSLPAMVATIMMLVTIYVILRRRGFWTTAIGLALTVTTEAILFYSNKLMPDIYVTFFTVLAAYTYYRQRYETQKHTGRHAVLFAVSLWLAFMSKGTVVLLLPWLLYLFVNDCLQKKAGKFWIWAIVSGAVCLTIYFASIKLMTGEFFYRFKSIAQNSYLNKCSYDQQPLAILLKRIYFDYFEMTVTSGMAVPMICIAAPFVSKGWRKMLKMADTTSYFVVSAMLMFLSGNFMTISATSYIPMCIDPRHYLFIIPIGAVGTALILQQRPSRIQTFVIATLTILATVYTFFWNRDICYHCYLPLTIVTITASIKQYIQIPCRYIHIALFVALMVMPIKLMTDQSYKYKERRNMLIDNIVNNSEYSHIFSDEACVRMLRYYNGFRANDRYIHFEEMYKETDNNYIGRAAVVLNYHTMALDGISYNDLPEFAYTAYQNTTPIMDQFGVKIYRLDSVYSTIPQYDTIIRITKNIDNERVGTYSTTITYPLDTLRAACCDTIIVKASAMCNCYAYTNCAMVISVEKADSTISWNSSPIDGSSRAYSHWFPFEYKHELHLDELPSGAEVRIYFFKTDNTQVLINDLSVNILKKPTMPGTSYAKGNNIDEPSPKRIWKPTLR